MTPKIDYALLGDAVTYYQQRGYTYVEVPWIVGDDVIRATLPEPLPFFELGVDNGDRGLSPYFGRGGALVGSAEQGFLELDLPPGKYVGVTPCFRIEPIQSLFYQQMFMKVELFDNRPQAKVSEVVKDAMQFFQNKMIYTGAKLVDAKTDIGIDINLAGIEIGSYGEREPAGFDRWVYGTGLALPRFSVARSISGLI